MSFTDKVNTITRSYSDLVAIDDDKALRKADLTLTDYEECKRLMPNLGKPGDKAETIYEKAAGFFKRHGYIVEPKGIGYSISI